MPAHSTASQRGSGCTYHSGLRVPFPPVAEGGGQGGGAALVVQGRPAVVDGRVDGDGPHAGGVAIAVAVVVAAAVPRGPHVDAAFAPAALGENRRNAANAQAHAVGATGCAGAPARWRGPRLCSQDVSVLRS